MSFGHHASGREPDDLDHRETEQVRELLDGLGTMPWRVRAALWTLQPVMLTRGGIVAGVTAIATAAFIAGGWLVQQWIVYG